MRASVRRNYLISALVVAAATSFCAASRSSHGMFLDDPVLKLYSFVMAVLVITWLVTDPDLPKSERPSFDHGLLLWMTFPLLAAYHQFIIRRWKGLLLVFGLLMLFFAPHIAMIVAAGAS